MADSRTVQRAIAPRVDARRRVARTVITPAPAPMPTVPPRPQGNLDDATPGQIIESVDAIWPRKQPRTWSRRKGLEWLLSHLAEQPGTTWQERWTSSGLNDGIQRVRQLVTGNARVDGELGHSLMLLCCLRVIRPSLAAFRINSFVRYHEHFEAAQNDPDLDRFLELVEQRDTSGHFKRCARFDIAGALTSQGIVLADLTAEALLHYATQTRAGGWGTGYEAYVGHLAWQLLHESGHFAPGIPATLRGAMRSPAMTPAELVEAHGIANTDVRGVLIAYLTRRSHDVDYTTLRNLSADLCQKFWKQIELINPTQADLALSTETYQAWRAALSVRADGQPRLSSDAVVTNVRALYLDLQGWAAQEPEQWARWVAPSPIASRETRSRAKSKRRAKERMDARVGILQPLLPVFMAAVTARRDHLRELLDAATVAAAGEHVVIGSKSYERLFSAGDARHQKVHGSPNIRVLDEATGKHLNVTFAEDAAFW